jgi:hypothetical protein
MKNLSCVTIAATGCLAALLMVAGCVSDHPGSRSMAYVDIESSGLPAVRQEVIRVFEDDGYTLSETPEALLFEREATQRDSVLFAHYGDDRLVMRVVVVIEPRRLGGSLVRCDAYAIRDGRVEGLPRMARRPYQNMLNRVKASLVTSGAPAPK